MEFVVVAAIVAGGVVTGLLFAFSNFVMSALAGLDPKNGMLAMQLINRKIINPIFVVLFLGSTASCGYIAIRSVMNLRSNAYAFLLAGSIAYLMGPFGITMLFNVPLNNRLALAKLDDYDEWTEYQVQWQRWNHVRTYIGIASIVLLSLGLAWLNS